MEIRFSDHAEQQIACRGLSREQVIRVAQQPEQIVYEPDVPLIAQSRISEHGKMYLIRVAFRDEEDIRYITPVYKTSKVSKYWQES